jgi:hypothetical protein
MDGRHLERHKRYRLRYRVPGLHMVDREAVMVYLGRGHESAVDYLLWSARPVAGTQRLHMSHILSISLVGDDVDCYVDRKVT